jgi:hypothetical protein
MAKVDKLTALRERAEAARVLELEINDLEQKLKERKAELLMLCRNELPDLMNELGMDRIGLPANGNFPGVDAVLKPFYRANIPVGWPLDKRLLAFDWLEKHQAGDLIKTQVEIAFPREEYKVAKQLAKKLVKEGFKPKVDQRVSHMTLTAWLQEQVERGDIPPLDVIGGEIGRVVVLENREA